VKNQKFTLEPAKVKEDFKDTETELRNEDETPPHYNYYIVHKKSGLVLDATSGIKAGSQLTLQKEKRVATQLFNFDLN
jgi:hypothetical protein